MKPTRNERQAAILLDRHHLGSRVGKGYINLPKIVQQPGLCTLFHTPAYTRGAPWSTSRGACQVNRVWKRSCCSPWTSPPSPTYYFPIIASEPIQRRIEILPDEADQAVVQPDWSVVRDRTQNVLALGPDNSNTLTFLATAELALTGPPESV